MAVGWGRSEDIATAYPEVTQLIWPEMLAFTLDRFHRYRQQKTQMNQWDAEGRELKALVVSSREAGEFTGRALQLMGVRGV